MEMFKLLAYGMREEANLEEPAADPTPAAQSPRVRIEYARRLEEENAVLKYELEEQKTSSEKRFRDQKKDSDKKVKDLSTKYREQLDRVTKYSNMLEVEVAQLKDEKARLERQNAQLLSTDKIQIQKLKILEDDLDNVNAENSVLKDENVELRKELRDSAEEMTDKMRQQLLEFTKSFDRVGDRMREKASGTPRSSSQDSQASTPKGQDLISEDPLSGETLRTVASVASHRDSDGARQSIDPRSLDALRTVRSSCGPRGTSPTPARMSRGVQASSSSGGNITIRNPRKRHRSDDDDGMEQ
ncbi:hypothetical protein K490DRAFT_52836 [Saccharata proteae CBS 121410]|uniref:Uncharacterized protein n=1 Tax=Saccharata proteae CBS 121410 TaxID=1314787 RepID=A0A9P4LYJ4_9PEZI|nr:hypothetical protein K490DRAFT_52836 [Saccharata proteae CBS 121410]